MEKKSLIDQFLESRIFHWSKKGSIAILDQVLFNGVHFLSAILLARWLASDEYGIFAVSYSIFLFLAALHMAILVEPMLVFGSGKYKNFFKEYLGVLFKWNFLLTISVSVILMIISLTIGFLHSRELCFSLLGISIATPIILLLWLLRRAFYVNLAPFWSTVGGGIYAVILLALVFLLHISHYLSPFTYFMSMGLSSLFVSLFFILLLRPNFNLRTFDSSVSSIINDHVYYGKWAIGTSMLGWAINNVYFIMLPFFIDFSKIGSLRALINLSSPAIQVNSALSFLLLPALSKYYSEDLFKMKQLIKLAFVFFVVLALCYCLFLLCFKVYIVKILYNNRYNEIIWLLPLVAFLPLWSGIANVLENILRALKKPNTVFWSYSISVTFLMAATIFSAQHYGIHGVLYCYNISYLLAVVVMFIFLKKIFSARRF